MSNAPATSASLVGSSQKWGSVAPLSACVVGVAVSLAVVVVVDPGGGEVEPG